MKDDSCATYKSVGCCFFVVVVVVVVVVFYCFCLFVCLFVCYGVILWMDCKLADSMKRRITVLSPVSSLIPYLVLLVIFAGSLPLLIL